MSGEPRLRGMAWDHPRARDPLEAISSRWSELNGIAVTWDARPLKYFEDQPLEELATRYDLVLIDYPFVGHAAASGLIVAADAWTEPAFLADQEKHSVGPSYDSYTWGAKQWALAIDAACQVSAVRPDLWDGKQSGPLPGTWQEVAARARQGGTGNGGVAIPLNPNHAYCAFLSVGVSLAGEAFWPDGTQFETAAALESLDFLRRLTLDLHPLSRTADPIAISERMASSREIAYVPLMFGYSSYSRSGFREMPLQFGNAPRGAGGFLGSVLGGVGIALSALSANRDAAADLARQIASPETQSGLYAASGGQPAHAAAWESPQVNGQTRDFFTSVRQSMTHAFVRPRVAGHRRFQELAGEAIHRFLWNHDITPRDCLASCEQLVESVLHANESAKRHVG